MTDPAFTSVSFETEGDPVRAVFRWAGELNPQETTTFSIWIKCTPDPDRNALLSTEITPDGTIRTYRHQFKPRDDRDCGRVVEQTDGRLVAEFPRAVVAEYGPTFSWWALLQVGNDDVDTYSLEKSSVTLAE
ncbi:hypothetical protein [Kineosporia babensis]|uniref:Uncharacterized protein n=1 Tax=Kineosporia babensis TaxID=499548 RepID=A0A9X1T468_9ACTN|nr:hypothetical protein [Kineosporia babensis]MCD5316468.1 hypothetical protein [Kineosporia babensis]